MTTETYMSLLVEESRVVFAIYGVGILATIGCYVVSLARLADVTIEDDLTIDSYGDVVALGTYLLGVPHT